MIIAGMAVAPTTVKVGYIVHGFFNRKWTIFGHFYSTESQLGPLHLADIG